MLNKNYILNKISKVNIHTILLVLFIALLFFNWFSNWLITNYNIPPGTDSAYHLQYISDIKKGTFSSYPPLFHFTVIIVNEITNISEFQILIILPLFLLGVYIPLCSLLCIRKIFPQKYYLFIPLLICYPSLIIEMILHGQLPEIFTISLVISTILILLHRNSAWTGLMLIPIFFSHHLTAISFGISFYLFYFFYLLMQRKVNRKIIVSFLALIFIATLIISFWDYYRLVFTNYFEYLIGLFSLNQLNSVSDTVPLQDIFSAWRAHEIYLIFLIIGIIFLLLRSKKNYISYLILIWFFVLFVFSRIPWDEFFSIRIWRQAIFPAMLIIGYGYLVLMNYFKKYILIVTMNLLMLASIIIFIPNLNYIISPADYSSIKAEDQEAFYFLKNIINSDNSNEKILANLNYSQWLRVFINPNNVITLTDKTLYQSDIDKDLWKIAAADISSIELIKKYHIKYIYSSGPIAGVATEYISFDVDNLIKTGFWKIIFTNERVSILKFDDL